MRRCLALLACAVALSACTGGADGRTAGGEPAASASVKAGRAQARPTAEPGEPRARLQAGTDSAAGMLVRLCEGEDCEQPGRPGITTLKVSEHRLLLFVLSFAPEDASIEVRRRGREKVVAGGALAPSDVMAYEAALKDGRYDVLLTASWGEQRAVWRFDVRVKDV